MDAGADTRAEQAQLATIGHGTQGLSRLRIQGVRVMSASALFWYILHRLKLAEILCSGPMRERSWQHLDEIIESDHELTLPDVDTDNRPVASARTLRKIGSGFVKAESLRQQEEWATPPPTPTSEEIELSYVGNDGTACGPEDTQGSDGLYESNTGDGLPQFFQEGEEEEVQMLPVPTSSLLTAVVEDESVLAAELHGPASLVEELSNKNEAIQHAGDGDGLRVKGGVAVTEKAVDLHTPDIIMHV